MGLLSAILALSFGAIVIGLVLLVIGLQRRNRRAIGQNEFTIEKPSNSGYLIAGVIALALGLLGMTSFGAIGA